MTKLLITSLALALLSACTGPLPDDDGASSSDAFTKDSAAVPAPDGATDGGLVDGRGTSLPDASTRPATDAGSDLFFGRPMSATIACKAMSDERPPLGGALVRTTANLSKTCRGKFLRRSSALSYAYFAVDPSDPCDPVVVTGEVTTGAAPGTRPVGIQSAKGLIDGATAITYEWVLNPTSFYRFSYIGSGAIGASASSPRYLYQAADGVHLVAVENDPSSETPSPTFDVESVAVPFRLVRLAACTLVYSFTP